MNRSLGKMLVGNILATAAIRFPDSPAIYCSSTDRRFTFRETNERANRLAQALLAAGLRKGDVVAFLSSNRAEIVEIYFALSRTGIIGLPLNYRLAATEMLELMRAMGASGLIYESKFATIAEQAGKTLKHVIQFGGEKPDFALDYETLLAAASNQAPDIESRSVLFQPHLGHHGPAEILRADAVQQQYPRSDVPGFRHDACRCGDDGVPDVRARGLCLGRWRYFLRHSPCPCEL